MAFVNNIKKTIYYFQRNGFRATLQEVTERFSQKQESYSYVAPSKEVLSKQMSIVEQDKVDQKELPLFSVLVPAFRTPEIYLRQLIDSLQEQSYTKWELVLADATDGDSVKLVADSYQDERIRYIKLSENGGISKNTNVGLEYVRGEYVGLLDHDDLLTADALFEMYQEIEKRKKQGSDVGFLYSDEDKCDGECQKFYEPHYKEDFNLDLLLSNNYICHFLVMKTDLMKRLKFRPEFDGAQDYDLVLRAAGTAIYDDKLEIVHISKVLYHWRCHEASTAANPKSKEYAYEAGKRALQAFADDRSMNAKAEHLVHLGFYKLSYEGDIWESRKDLGAIGLGVFEKGKLVAGRMDEKGNVFYEGFKKGQGGYLHRGKLTQDAEVVDIRKIRIAPSCRDLFEQVVGVKYTENPETGYFDVTKLESNIDYKKLSIKLCKEIRNAGYTILWKQL